MSHKFRGLQHAYNKSRISDLVIKIITKLSFLVYSDLYLFTPNKNTVYFYQFKKGLVMNIGIILIPTKHVRPPDCQRYNLKVFRTVKLIKPPSQGSNKPFSIYSTHLGYLVGSSSSQLENRSRKPRIFQMKKAWGKWISILTTSL